MNAWCPVCCATVSHDSSTHGSVRVYSVEPNGKRIYAFSEADESLLPTNATYGSDVPDLSTAFSADGDKTLFYNKSDDAWTERT